MVSVGQIVSKTVGVAGLGLAMYDAVQCSKMSSRKNAHARQADYLEKSFYNSRTIDNISANSNRLRAKTFDLETWNPLPAFFGKISGGVKGFLYSLICAPNVFNIASPPWLLSLSVFVLCAHQFLYSTSPGFPAQSLTIEIIHPALHR